MELGTKYHAKNRRHSHTIKVTFIPGITKEQIYVYDDEESYLRRASGKAKLIVRLNDMRVYGSLLSAARIAKISRERILWCCLDDVTSIFSRGREVQFAFGRYKK